MQIFLNASRKGAVLFSLGSTLRADDLPDEKIQLFINVFHEFSDYNFLWKFENNETIENLPKNICIKAWVPQSDVLAHPKLKAFITHGGLCFEFHFKNVSKFTLSSFVVRAVEYTRSNLAGSTNDGDSVHVRSA